MEKRTVKIRVRDRCQAYHASGAGERASCTTGPDDAALALARKVFGEKRFTVRKVGRLEEMGPFNTIDTCILYRAEEVFTG